MTTKKKLLGIIMASVLALGSLGLVACGDDKASVTEEEWKNASKIVIDNVAVDKDFSGFDGGIGIKYTLTMKSFDGQATDPLMTVSIEAEQKVKDKNVYIKDATTQGGKTENSESFYAIENGVITRYTLNSETQKYQQSTFTGIVSVDPAGAIKSLVGLLLEDMSKFAYGDGSYKADVIDTTLSMPQGTLDVKFNDSTVKFENGKIVSIECAKLELFQPMNGQKVKTTEYVVKMIMNYDGITVTLPSADKIVSND